MKKYFIIVFFTILMGAFACEEFLAEDPKTLVTEGNFFGADATESGVEQFINGIYPGNWWTINDRRWSWFATVPADEFNQSLSGPGFDVEGVQYDHHEFDETQFNIYRQWNYIWWPAARANTFLHHYPSLEERFAGRWTELENFKGQALFFRAYNFFTGVQMWGPIPLVTVKPDGKNYPNSTIPEIYDQIIADLTEIVENDYLPEWTELDAADRGRITMSAAKTLLAKVYLTKSYYPEVAEAGDAEKAAQYAKDVIDNSGHGLITDPILDENGDVLYTAYEAVFLPVNKNGLEGIWEFQFNQGQATNNNNVEWAIPGWFGSWGNARFEATPLLYNSFESGDIRKESYITGPAVVSPRTGSVVNTNGKIYMTKFQDDDLSTPHNHDNNWYFLRFAEVLLIYAEAVNKANNGSTPEALEAINRVRNRAGLADLTGPYGYDEFLDLIKEERFKELAGEGHRLVDLRRWGYDYLKQRVEMSQPEASVEPHEVLYPFPSAELRVNPLIEQNPGY